MPSSGTTSVIPLDWQSKATKGRATLLLSTNADGVTGAQVADMGGCALAALIPSTLTSDANYSFRAGHTTAFMGTVRNSTGGILTIGSTAAGAGAGQVIAFDPAPFTGLRFIQVISGTTAAAIAAASSGATVDVLGAGIGNRIL